MRVVLYARVSSDKQDVDLSISAQLRALREYAARNGCEVVREYVDEAESGRTADRPQFQRMIAEARRPSKSFQEVLIWKFSRFARSREDAIVFKSLLKKHGVRVISITEPSEDSPTGKLMEAIIESLDEFYSANLAQEVIRGMREAASRGFCVCSRTPYGYRRVKVQDGRKERPKLDPDPSTAPVVARIYRAVLNGESLKTICRMLNGEGVAAPGGKAWMSTSLHRMITNEAYTGTLVWGRRFKGGQGLEPVRVENAWPSIVDKETFDRAQEAMHERAPALVHPRRVSSPYLLSGLLKCGSCSKSLIGQEAKSGKFAYYVCGTLIRRGKGTCDAPYLNARRLEELVVDKIKERILTDENMRELVRLVNEELDATAREYDERLKTSEGELADVQRRLERLYDALETGKLTLDDLSPRIQHLRHRQDQLQAAKAEVEGLLAERRANLLDASDVVKYVDDMRTLLQESGLVERKAFIRSFVQEIVVKGKEAVVRYTLPLLAETHLDGGRAEALTLSNRVLATARIGTPLGTLFEPSTATSHQLWPMTSLWR
ncbi:MAG: recombinase family protein [Chloroflexota bacterium]|nr:recombinase family protein [Chloroflexota bacterium]